MDGIPDYRDADPFSNRGAVVDNNGVEYDDDNDGVPNIKDLEIIQWTWLISLYYIGNSFTKV